MTAIRTIRDLLLSIGASFPYHGMAHSAAWPSFHSSLQRGGESPHVRPRRRSTRRDDVPPQSMKEIPPNRHIDYGADGHPYEQVGRVRERGKSSGRHLEAEDEAEISRILQTANEMYQPLRIHFDTVSGTFKQSASFYSRNSISMPIQRFHYARLIWNAGLSNRQGRNKESTISNLTSSLVWPEFGAHLCQ